MTKCSDFHRDKNIPWIEMLDSKCDVCIYSENTYKCKLRTDNRTAFCHDYHYGNNNRVSMVLR